ncbi:MAG: thiamine pyrophosphate-dependent enzyme [Candidatus Bathyarchaeota archaeon]|nr:thiamine pyrophosphate-dependent enzyme [Candidatus Bathyarchaeota archaeon]
MTEELFDKFYEESLIQGGTTCCPGCGGPLFWKLALQVFGRNTIVYGDGPCAMCALRLIKIPRMSIHFSFNSDGATGIAAALRAKGRDDITLISSAGDGSTADISFGKVSAAAERNENMIQICIDNEAYMNTGIQKSGLTPYGAWTTTTPMGKESNKKDIPMIMAAHKIPYVATASVAYPQDLKRKLEKAKGIKGFRYIHTIIPCPTGWRFDTAKAVEVTKLGVDTWVTPLYEVNEGVLNLTRKPEQKPVTEYLSAQGRFRRLSEEQLKYIQDEVDKKRTEYLEMDGKRIIY